MQCYDEEMEFDQSPPLVKGGNGHSAAQVRFSAIAIAVCGCLIIVAAGIAAIVKLTGMAVPK